MEFIICCEGAAHDKYASGRAEAATSLGMNERPHFDPTRGGKHMFCWSWQAGYLQRGLGIPPAEGMGRWRDGKGREEEEVSMCLWPPDMKLDRMDAYFPFVRYVWYLVKMVEFIGS